MPKYQIVSSSKFLKDLKLLKKRSLKDFALLQEIVAILSEEGYIGLDKKHRAHKLKGTFSGYWECHVKPDLLLIWNENEEIKASRINPNGFTC